ncbi:MAG: acetate kinase [candidate division SR1 bacterium]|nr:MAG: acetate kinase [candidate division SR1 bacterium]
MKEIHAVGHRVVHGGEKFSESVLVTDEIIKEIEDVSDLAPLHNPANLLGITACKDLMGEDTPQVAVFDTAFHQTMDPEYFLYAIPYEYYTKHKIRRYGFHGTSHKYVAHRTCEILKRDIQEQKIITCHLGNGASLAAVKDGKVIDTSMGFTPLAGIMMGTRSGDIDPSILEYLCKKENLTIEQATTILNKKSGLLGVSQQSSDMRDIEYGDKQAQLALDIYINRIVHFIGAYTALMGGLDAIVFTAGVGERGPLIREKVINRLNYMGIHIDEQANEKKAEEVIISTAGSKVTALVVPTEEELMIANDTYTIVENLDI